MTHHTKSSMIQSTDYDESTKQLSVTFNTGKTYVYHDVHRDHYRAMNNSPSAGQYFNDQIKNNHAFDKVEDE